MTDVALRTLLAASSTTGGPTDVLLQYGAVGAIAVLLGVFALSAYRRERDRADRLEAQLQLTNERIIDRLAEVLASSRDALAAANEFLRDLSRRRS